MYQEALKGKVVSVSEDAWERAERISSIPAVGCSPLVRSRQKVGGIVMVADKINELVEAQEHALEASRVKSQFLANIVTKFALR